MRQAGGVFLIVETLDRRRNLEPAEDRHRLAVGGGDEITADDDSGHQDVEEPVHPQRGLSFPGLAEVFGQGVGQPPAEPEQEQKPCDHAQAAVQVRSLPIPGMGIFQIDHGDPQEEQADDEQRHRPVQKDGDQAIACPVVAKLHVFATRLFACRCRS